MFSFLQRTRGMSMQEAADYSGVIWLGLLDKFREGQQEIRSFGPEVDKMVKTYFRGIENWIVGNIHWSYDCHRYFGVRGQEVKATKTAKLGPVELE